MCNPNKSSSCDVLYLPDMECFLSRTHLCGKGGRNKILVSEDQGHLLISFCVIITLYTLFAFEITSYKGKDEC